MNVFGERFLRLRLQECENWPEMVGVANEVGADHRELTETLTPAEQRWQSTFYNNATPQAAWNAAYERLETGEMRYADNIFNAVACLRGQSDAARIEAGGYAEWEGVYAFPNDN
jgi:hypothetical protein